MALLENLKKQFDQLINPDKEDGEEEFFPPLDSGKSSAFSHPSKDAGLKQNLNSSPAPIPFAEIYKTAYTHGLEKTYALETVNINSIRKLTPTTSPSLSSSISEEVSEFTVLEKKQLEFDFGQGFREWMAPLFLEEPIHLLGLSSPAEKCLEKNGKYTLQDLLKADTPDLVFLKGMGQGHIDEIQQALKKYLKNRSLEKDYSLGWGSWIKSLVGSYDRKKSYIFLEKFDLSSLLSLSPLESMEIRKLSAQKKEEWSLDVKQFCTSPLKCAQVQKRMQEVVDTFIKPWMLNRSGIATLQELKERLQKVSSSSKIAPRALEFFNQLFYSNHFCLASFLPEVEKDLFCVDRPTAAVYEDLTKKASTYFYSLKVSYNLDHFIDLLEKEAMKEWNCYARADMQKMLRLSPLFSVRKGASHQLEIRLS
ncbi:DNA-directed RNA polymerase subunit alpha C-terminal domain-containing protein [Parachlamydia sp. AcF125]|uniref:DNA-directed RNA polymerase subunit alpha C-terminal domain-containing protein n=1 Tax=Parachlamydia sp. AcF125 TaxID=2795736 RepID=UPI001BC8DD3C|nr:DNA-directed RNA polymerase subunit alpha C-terminal domain-containing protein [Parachlamydia sp. AcF125]MBS4168422.1 DNA-directed RNA polymerase subunit alpha [Parachlamydia sp. AcF125]